MRRSEFHPAKRVRGDVKAMSTVYKYCDGHGVKILQNLELKITPPNQFNDPFEFTPHVICSSLERKVRNLFTDQDAIKQWFLETTGSGQFSGTLREFREQLRNLEPEVVTAIASHMPAINADVQGASLDRASKKYGVLCLSARRDSIVMWGHYCDKHRGIVVGFDDSWEIFRRGAALCPVNYVRERVVWDSSLQSGGSEERAFTERLIFSKNDEWKYEEELRQLFTLVSLPRQNPDNGTVGYFLPLPPEKIVSVSLGFRCPLELKEKVCAALRDQGLTHVKLDHAVLHDSDFALRFE